MFQGVSVVHSSKISQEFKDLIQPTPCRGIYKKTLYSAALSNPSKNRYPDVLPYEGSRVKLSTAANDYINASFIPGRDSEKCYISSQAPLPHTFADFWAMVWEHDVPLIVMLTRFVEKRRVKAHCYWPGNCGEQVTFGDISVKLLENFTDGSITMRQFLVSKGEEARNIFHVHYTEWPDYGVPKSTSAFRQLLQIIDTYRLDEFGRPCPIVVHCSAGIGRSGTLIAVHSFLHHQRNDCGKDVPQIVNDLRKSRMGMVQTKEQYRFIYQVIEDCHESTHCVRRSISQLALSFAPMPLVQESDEVAHLHSRSLPSVVHSALITASGC